MTETAKTTETAGDDKNSRDNKDNKDSNNKKRAIDGTRTRNNQNHNLALYRLNYDRRL